MEKTQKFKICIFAGSIGVKAVEMLWKELSDQHLVHSFALKVIPATTEGLDELQTILHEGRTDVVINVPFFENNEINDKLKAINPSTEALPLVVCGDLVAIRLLPANTSDESYLTEVDPIVETLLKFSGTLRSDFAKPLPRLAVFSTAKGSQAQLSDVDQKVLIPAINQVFKAKVPIFGPYIYEPFMEAHNGDRFDGLVIVNQNMSQLAYSSYGSYAMHYRSQQPFIWLSPIDVQVEQLPSALMQAIFMARDILHNRIEYAEMSKNPLKFELKRENNEHQAF